MAIRLCEVRNTIAIIKRILITAGQVRFQSDLPPDSPEVNTVVRDPKMAHLSTELVRGSSYFLPGLRSSGTQVRFPVEPYPWHLIVEYGPVSIHINGSASSITCDTAERKKTTNRNGTHARPSTLEALELFKSLSEERVTYGKRRRPKRFQPRTC